MKSINLIFAVLALFSVTVSAQPFTVLKATGQPFAGGIKGSGTGVNYEIVLVVKTCSDHLAFKDMWIQGEYFPVTLRKMNQHEAVNKFNVNDTLYIYATKKIIEDKIPGKEEGEGEKKVVKPLPVKSDAEIVLAYKEKRKRKYYYIEKVEKLPKEYRQ